MWLLNADFFEFEKIEKNHFSVYCPSSEPTERQRDEANEGLSVIVLQIELLENVFQMCSNNGLPNVTSPARANTPLRQL